MRVVILLEILNGSLNFLSADSILQFSRQLSITCMIIIF